MTNLEKVAEYWFYSVHCNKCPLRPSCDLINCREIFSEKMKDTEWLESEVEDEQKTKK